MLQYIPNWQNHSAERLPAKHLVHSQLLFFWKYIIHPPVRNDNQVPLHRNESSDKKAMSLRNQNTFLKEDHMRSREHVTFFIIVSSLDEISWPNLCSRVLAHRALKLLHQAFNISDPPMVTFWGWSAAESKVTSK